MKRDGRETFSIVNPPPNAYMRPHIGNVSGYAYQDVLLRYHRLFGKKVLGQPGKDHAGIQGEVVVEKIFIENKGKTKLDMGREKFYKASYAHFEKLMPMVMSDEQRIGLSSDYDRNLFTLDPKVVETVLGTFIKMFADNMVYKGVRIVNWDPVAQTTLADIDTERVERETELVYIKYPVSRQRVWFLSFRSKEVLERIRSGKKTIETRALNPDEPDRFFGDIQTGDLIVCVDKTDGQTLYRKVREVTAFTSMKDAFDGLDLRQVFEQEPGSLDEMRERYASLADGYAERIDKNGLVAITFAELGDDDFLTVATTRAETMLGDTAITVNPADKRYKELTGKTVALPLVDRTIPVITSARVDKEFGTGAVKLTPAHSYDDYVMMTEWNEEHPDDAVGYINIISKAGTLSGPVPERYWGMKSEDARAAVIRDLDRMGLIVKREPHTQSVMIGERSKAVIEQIMSSQWFIDVERLKQPAIAAVKNGDVTIHPEYMNKKYLHWMENLHDWPVSRSLWWGYRIPVWYKGELKEEINDEGQVIESINGTAVKGIYDAVEKGLALVQIDSPGEGWIQDEDVFDTWFSSGQWPYATIKANGLMDTFYPTDVMETGYDILELWVSRMIMLSLYTQGTVPFTNVYLHGLVKAPDGQKMSKSKNNVIAPEEIIKDYGADSLRLLYVVGNKPGSSYPVSYEKLEGYKRFLNKIWNAAKFVLLNLQDVDGAALEDMDRTKLAFNDDDRTMHAHLDALVSETKRRMEGFHLGVAAQELYDSFWHTFADIYIEQIKERLYTRDKEGNPLNMEGDDLESRRAAQWSAYTILKTYLVLLHPFIPFITETVWQELPRYKDDAETIMYAKWPGS
ncbi:MAG: Valine--tRNA ligase [candidate division WS6 bacterium OLB20]|uniref:valine--tRNA ligase n=1 Tax=candidate division WS6 bacterium OLB20 TaxID=1617426 RepID=A0A136LZ49_9BACT|nr:MAG: Valine--tRNA ligase [candidate division WS6 bacterium OLB20]